MGNLSKVAALASFFTAIAIGAVCADEMPWKISDHDSAFVQNCIVNNILKTDAQDKESGSRILRIVRDKVLPTADWTENIFETFKEFIIDLKKNNATSLCPSGKSNNVNSATELFVQLGKFSNPPETTTIKTCSISRPNQRGSEIIIQYNCINTIFHPPGTVKDGWCEQYIEGNSFFLAVFEKCAGKIKLVGNGKFDEADGPNRQSENNCHDEPDPTKQ